MPDNCPLPDVDAASLEPLVRDLLGEPLALVEETWSCHPLGGGGSEGAGLYRLRGSARLGARSRPWTLIVKVCAAGRGTNPSAWDYPLREGLAYRSGLLDGLPGALAVPRCLAVDERTDGTIRIWLEAVEDEAPGAWTVDQFAAAARRLGRFNGAYLAGLAVPDHPWLSKGWLRGYVEASGSAVAELELLSDARYPPPVRRLFPPATVAEFRRLWDKRDAFFSALDRLPRTLCHHDAFRRNLMSRAGPQGDEMVALDWACVGDGAVGEELVALVVASPLFFEAEGIALRDLDAACFTAYVSGLRDAGWAADERLARLGFVSAGALRYTLGTLRLVLAGLSDPDQHPALEALLGRPISAIVDGWAELWAFQLGLADEARALRPLVID